jgi:type III secretory pathway lipoprotein EscJ
MANEFTKIAEITNPIEAEMMLQLLHENSINAVQMNKRDSSYTAFGVIEIYCHTEQVVQALHLISNNLSHEE